MEVLFRRDLSLVRLHTASIAADLGADAFTTGSHVVFAPGRKDFRTARGISLLAHELSHLGTVLAFKRPHGLDGADREEARARHQEGVVQRIIEQGWPSENRPTVRRMRQPLIDESLSVSGVSRAHSDADGMPIARLRDVNTLLKPSAPLSASTDVAALARQVFSLLKAELRTERERNGLLSR
jgi:hypothetical protein